MPAKPEPRYRSSMVVVLTIADVMAIKTEGGYWKAEPDEVAFRKYQGLKIASTQLETGVHLSGLASIFLGSYEGAPSTTKCDPAACQSAKLVEDSESRQMLMTASKPFTNCSTVIVVALHSVL